jgi:hypothetical protein
LEIKLVLAGLAGILLPLGVNGRQCYPHWTAGARIVQDGFSLNPAFEATVPQYGKDNVAVSSQPYWRTSNPMSNPIFQNRCFIRAGSVA